MKPACLFSLLALVIPLASPGEPGAAAPLRPDKGVAFLQEVAAAAGTNERPRLDVALRNRGAQAGAELTLELALADGSCVVGVPRIAVLPFKTDYASLQLDLAKIRELTAGEGGGRVMLLLRNGDRLSGAVDLPALALSTVFGEITVAFAHIRRIQVRAGDSPGGDLSQNLVLHYSFDQIEDGMVADRSAKENRGTVRGGAVLTTEGRVGSGLALDGIDDYVDAGNAASLQVTTGFTLCAWIRPDPAGGSFSLICKSYGSDNGRRGIEFQLGHDATLSGYFWSRAGSYFSGVVQAPLMRYGVWSHVAMVHDPGLPVHQMRFYIDGEERTAAFGYETTASVPVVATVSAPFRIGCMRPGNEHFKGVMDEVMIFNRVLTADEIAGLARP